MFRSMNKLIGYKVGTVDGEEGTVADFLFDDKRQMVRYVVVKTGGWLMGRDVLISPVAVDSIDNDQHRMETVLAKESIEKAPGIATNRPVSRQQELQLVSYYNWPMYWGPVAPPTSLEASQVVVEETAVKEFDPHLRSTKAVVGYSINCISDSIGHVKDLIVDLDTWTIRYLVIDTGNWLPGKKVIVGFDWLTEIHREDNSVFVDLTRKQIETAPPYDPNVPVNRDYETTLYDFYDRPTYW